MGYEKPLPAPDPETEEFWNGCRDHRLLIQRCGSCGTHRFPPTSFCPHCQSDETEWVEASGRGRVFSWIVVRHPVPREIYAGDVPYVVAIVALDEGVRMVGNLVGIDPDAVAADLPVKVTFENVTDEITLPEFEPIGD
ncbi:Zn-ribbon domain-containing OB-fold protein [Microbaculum marinum]|uniref:Zn-ribbon domain-containing OB-fold protein n=1 Tax=Microbaculum marinum TaxID=1764581 RepID=A0AAW9RMS7_9HYPH